jgi:hypothetical protein
MHFRPNNVNKTNFASKCGPDNLAWVPKYVYLGLTLQEHLDNPITAKFVAQSASRALGLLTTKKVSRGNVLQCLYKVIWLVGLFCGSIWSSYLMKQIVFLYWLNSTPCYVCLFLGTSSLSPSAVLIGDMGWQTTFRKQMISVSNFWHRLCKMPRSRLN